MYIWLRIIILCFFLWYTSLIFLFELLLVMASGFSCVEKSTLWLCSLSSHYNYNTVSNDIASGSNTHWKIIFHCVYSSQEELKQWHGSPLFKQSNRSGWFVGKRSVLCVIICYVHVFFPFHQLYPFC